MNFNLLSYIVYCEDILVTQLPGNWSESIQVLVSSSIFQENLLLAISFIEHREHGELRVPLSITVEIVPASIHAWCHVQGQAHNPRVRVTTPLQRPLAALISHLQEKWRRSELKLVSFGFTNFDQHFLLHFNIIVLFFPLPLFMCFPWLETSEKHYHPGRPFL